jgi:hypothetical protein
MSTEQQHPPGLILPVDGMPEMHLRQVQQSDAGEIFDLIEANRDHLEQYQWDIRKLQTSVDVEQDVARMLKKIEKGSLMQYCIVEGEPKAPGDMVGMASIYSRDALAHGARFASWSAERVSKSNYEQRGLATMIMQAKQRWGLHRIERHVAAPDAQGALLAKSLGCYMIEGYNQLVQGEDGKSRAVIVKRWIKHLTDESA